jgi:hypothetical protein
MSPCDHLESPSSSTTTSTTNSQTVSIPNPVNNVCSRNFFASQK